MITEIKNSEFLEYLLKSNYTLVFDINFLALASINFELFMNFIIFLINKGYSENLILSNGVTFKKDLKRYGGYGYDYILTAEDYLIKNNIKQSIIDSIMQNNIINKLSWAQMELKVIEEEKTVPCSGCGLRKPKNDMFSKLGQDFCTMKCLRENIK